MMKKYLLLLLLGSLITFSGVAQDYRWGVGARIGGEMSGIDVKYKISASRAVEAIFAVPYDNGFVATGLYEWTIPVISEGFNFYYGVGGHIGSWDHDFALGLDAVVGLEYKIPEAPVAFSIDYKPVFNIVSNTKLYMLDFAFSVRFTF